METSLVSSTRPARNKCSYWLANTSVIHRVSKNPSSTLFLATHTPENKSPVTESLFEVLITVESNHIANLRHVASEACGGKIDSFEILPAKKLSQRLVRLRCFGKGTIALLMSAVVSQLENAEFGRVHAV